jgi:hypothetical protein
MKQAAILFALAHLAPRLKSVRKRSWVLAALAIVAILAIMILLAIMLFSWGWGQLPMLADSARQTANATMDKVGQAVPEMKTRIEPLLDASGLPLAKTAGNWTSRDVSGIELPGVERYPGFLRTHYARDRRRVDLRYAGQGDFHEVLGHYITQFRQAGYAHEIVSATPAAERHRFIKTTDVVEFEIRRTDKDEKIEIIIADNIG